MKQDISSKSQSDYSRLSREELLEEIGKLQTAMQARLNDTTGHSNGHSGHEQVSLERVINSIDEVVYHIDLTKPEGERIRFVGSNIEKVFGVSRAEFMSGQNMFMNNCHPEDVMAIREKSEELRKTKQAGTFTYRYFNKHKGAFIWIEERVIPTYAKDGTQYEIIGVARDITEQVNNRTQLLQSE